MPYLTIENFKYGLDTRRGELTSQAGILATCENGHVNQGGEIDKRKAFVLDASVLLNDSNGDSGCFWFEVSSAGKTVFGSALPSTSGYVTTAGVSVLNLVSVGINGKLNITATNGVITGYTVNTAGTGYAVNDYVSVTTAQGFGAVFKVLTVNGGGGILTVSIIHGQLQDQPVLAAVPAGYTYVQLKHPVLTDFLGITNAYGDANVGSSPTGFALADNTFYDRAKHRMTRVNFSRVFNGNTFVSATFSDGNTFLFYNGTVIRQSYTGTVLAAATANARNFYIAYEIRQQVLEQEGWYSSFEATTIAVIPQYVPILGGSPYMFVGSPGTTTFQVEKTVSTAAGVMEIQLAVASAATGASTASFTVNGGAGNTYDIKAPISTGSSTRVYITDARVSWAVSNNATATAIAAAITASTLPYGYTATANAAVVTVTAPMPSSPLLGSYNQGTLVVVSADGTANGNHVFSTSTYVNAFGRQAFINLNVTWAVGDTWNLQFVEGSSDAFTVGKGNIASQNWIDATVVGQRVFLAFDGTFAYSAIDDPTGWEEQNTGAGQVDFQSQFGNADTVQTFSLYQGRLAAFGIYSIQIWTMDANPASFVRNQILQNIGTDAPQSVTPFGELDVFFRALSGVRSLRVRDSSLNGYVTDIGSPIDSILASNTAAQRQASLSILEPTDHRYWLYENGVIYVLSYFPTLKISAWSTYLPQYDAQTVIAIGDYNSSGLRNIDSLLTPGVTYSWVPNGHETDLVIDGVSYTGATTFIFVAQAITARGTPLATCTAVLTGHVQTTFIPEKLAIYNEQVFIKGTDGKVYSYGGSNGTTYDYAICTTETPWLDVKNRVSTRKGSTGIDIVASGSWNVYASMDYRANLAPTTMKQVIVGDGISTPSKPVQSYTAEGTHIKMKASTSPLKAEAATLSALVWHYKDEGEKR